jgi:hypothetical protein
MPDRAGGIIHEHSLALDERCNLYVSGLSPELSLAIVRGSQATQLLFSIGWRRIRGARRFPLLTHVNNFRWDQCNKRDWVPFSGTQSVISYPFQSLQDVQELSLPVIIPPKRAPVGVPPAADAWTQVGQASLFVVTQRWVAQDDLSTFPIDRG